MVESAEFKDILDIDDCDVSSLTDSIVICNDRMNFSEVTDYFAFVADVCLSAEGYLYLTESGRATAEKIYERHLFLSEWLEKLGVDPVVAASDACKIEHVISTESFAAIKKHIDLNSME